MNLRKIPHILLAFVLTAIYTACGEAGKSEDPVKAATKHNEGKFDNEQEKTAAFLVYASDLNLYEVQLGELAMGNGHHPAVKKLAATMVGDHKKTLAEIRSMAEERQVTLPAAVSDEKRRDCDKLGKQTLKEFDEHYCEMMIKGHEEAIKRFEKEAEEGADEKIRVWAFEQLPSLRSHLDHAMECESTCERDNGKDTAVVVSNKEARSGALKSDSEVKKDKNSGQKKADW